MDFIDYKIEEDGRVLCEPCLSFVFFSDVTLSKETPPDLLAPHRVFLDEFRDVLTYSRTDGSQMHAQRIRPDDFNAWPNWLNDPKKRSRGGYGVELRSGKSPDEWVSPYLEAEYSIVGRPNAYYRICLPLTWLGNQGASGVQRFLQDSLAGFPLHSGYVGYSFAWERSDPHVLDVTAPYFFRWLQRHPGILAPSAGTQSNVVPFSFTDIGWITLLGKELVEKLGGIEQLQSVLSNVADVVVTEIGSGSALIRIGDAPRLGDTTTGDTLENYRAVGAALSSLRDRAYLERKLVIHGLSSKHHPEERKTWINRFFPSA